MTRGYSRAKGMLTMLPRMFDIAAAATIDVFLCRRTMTVIAAIASAMKQASAIPRMSEPSACAADDDHDAAKRHDAREHGSQMRDFPQPYPGERGGEEGAGRDDDRHIGHAR